MEGMVLGMSQERVTGILMGILVGAVAGAVTALLYAPASGKETQKKIRDTAERSWEDAKTGYDKKLTDIRKSMDEGFSEMKSQVAKVAKKTG